MRRDLFGVPSELSFVVSHLGPSLDHDKLYIRSKVLKFPRKSNKQN